MTGGEASPSAARSARSIVAPFADFIHARSSFTLLIAASASTASARVENEEDDGDGDRDHCGSDDKPARAAPGSESAACVLWVIGGHMGSPPLAVPQVLTLQRGTKT